MGRKRSDFQRKTRIIFLKRVFFLCVSAIHHLNNVYNYGKKTKHKFKKMEMAEKNKRKRRRKIKGEKSKEA